jgi:hypothetical protein
MNTLTRRGPAALVAALVVAVLSACAPAATPSASTTSTPKPTSSASVSPTPTPSASAVPVDAAPAASIIIGAEATDIVDATGAVLGSLRYSTDGAAAVALATALLGEPTSVAYVDQMPHFAPVDTTTWGGFTIQVNNYGLYNGEEVKQPTGDELLYEPPFSVLALSAEAVTGVAIVSVDGTAVGDSYASVTAGKDASLVYADPTFGYGTVALSLPTSFPGMTNPGDGLPPMAHGVIATANVLDGPITSIFSPTDLYSLV